MDILDNKDSKIGIVISTIDSPSTTKISFVGVNKEIHKGEYIQIKYKQGILIGLVIDVVKTNRYFENNDSVKEFENNNIDIKDQFPVSDWEFLEGVVKPLGVFNEGMFLRSTYPVSPGQEVYLADINILKKFLHLKEDGIFLGNIQNPSLEVKFDINRLLQKHLAILAQSGAGKSYLTSVLLEELLSRPEEKGGVATILFDTHGEYSHFSEVLSSSNNSNNLNYKDYSFKTKKINSKDIKIGCSSLSAEFYYSLLPNLSHAQKRELSKIISKLQEDKKHGAGPFDLKDIIKEINSSDIKENISSILISALYELDSYKLFGKIDFPSIFDIVSLNNLTIIDISKEINKKKKQIILYYFAHKLFYARVNSNVIVPPFLLVVEEAHQFAPESASRDKALAKGILETIAREGRKFGACICLISQRPVHLSTTVLSQANTHIILRITNPYDLNHIAQSSEGLDQKSMDMITSLRVGEALIVGEASSYPVFFKVRKKNSIDSCLDVTLSSLSKSYLDFKMSKDKDVSAFI
ncbi:MAG: ATP-binding protein [Candidatus ainarchaeum sp.]|nr:ATP-binding protein [Candidatus ainarchaeum sp.]MDD3976219.1 ATP-binding protein [Candidatus ainarchaeum sp.]